MSNTIGIDSFRSAVTNRPDDSVLRISKHTGEVTSKSHGLLSRLVRFVTGPTNADLRSNERIADQFIKQMRTEFGPAIAKQAMIHANILHRRDDGTLAYHPNRPMNARIVTAALAEANKLAGTLDHGEAKAELARVENSLPPFPSTIEERDEDAAQPEMTRRRMQFELGAYRLDVDVQSGNPPNVDAHMSRIAALNKASDPESVDAAVEAYGRLRETVGDLARLCGAKASDGADAFALLQAMRDLNEEILATGAVTGGGKISPDERELPQHAAILAFCRGLDAEDAATLSRAMGDKESNAALLSKAFEEAMGNISSVREMPLFGAVSEPMKVFQSLIGEIDRNIAEHQPTTGSSSTSESTFEMLAAHDRDAQDERIVALAQLIHTDGQERVQARGV